jgi:hypothetical protein
MTEARISILARTRGLAIAVTVLCLGAPAAQAQVAPVRYWIPGGPFGFGGAVAETPSTETSADGTGFGAGDAERTGFSFRSASVPVNSLTGGFGWTGPGGAGAFGNFGALTYDTAQYGYSFKGVGDLPVTLFGGVDTLKYNPDVFSNVTSFGSGSSIAATAVHAGVEIKPTSNLSLSLSAGYVQPSGAVDSDIRSSLLPGESPMFSGGRR